MGLEFDILRHGFTHSTAQTETGSKSRFLSSIKTTSAQSNGAILRLPVKGRKKGRKGRRKEVREKRKERGRESTFFL